MRYVRIVSSYFVAGGEINTRNWAPIIYYMHKWNKTRIEEYCKKKGWKVEFSL